MLKLLKYVREKWVAKELAEKSIFYDSIDLYTDVAISWLISVIKKPLVSLMIQPSLNLDFNSVFVNSKKSFLKLKVRVEAIFKAILIEIKKEEMPLPLAKFLNSIITPNEYLPKEFFSIFEKKRLDLNERWALSTIKNNQKKLIIGIFFFVRILLDKILLNPSKIVLVRKFYNIS